MKLHLEPLAFETLLLDAEQLRIGSELANKPINQFSYLRTGINDERLIKEFARMQEIYVFNNEHMITVSELQKSIKALSAIFE